MVTSEHVPTIGRIVHFRQMGTCRAALITEIAPLGDVVGLCVFNSTGLAFPRHVEHDGTDDPHEFTYHWPEEHPRR